MSRGLGDVYKRQEEYKSVADQIQAEVDRRYERLAACAEHPLL